jgi:putative transposase
MLKNRHLSKSITDSGWGEFLRQLKYKSHWRGSVVIQVGIWEATSKLCSSCGYKNEELKLSDRNWACPGCGCHHDRDLNAAKNIQQIGWEAPELTPSVFSIRKIQADSQKQESLAS